MNGKQVGEGVIGGFIVWIGFWILPLGPLIATTLISFFDEPSPRVGVGMGALSGMIGFGLVLGTIVNSRFSHGFFSLIGAESGAPAIETVVLGIFVYVVGFATLGGWLGARIAQSPGSISDPW